MINNADIAAIAESRSRFNARETDSSLVAWICSDAWLDALAFEREHGAARGRVVATAWSGDEANTIAGEINAYTRDHVDAFANDGGQP